MSKRYLTESEAWTRIARAYEHRKPTKIYQHGDLPWSGLCYAIFTLKYDRRITTVTKAAMEERLCGTFQPSGVSMGVHWWGDGKENWEARAIACYFLAILAQEAK